MSDWTRLVRVCKVCCSILGETRAAIALKKCPECYAPTVPVEDMTDSVRVVREEEDRA